MLHAADSVATPPIPTAWRAPKSSIAAAFEAVRGALPALLPTFAAVRAARAPVRVPIVSGDRSLSALVCAAEAAELGA